MNIVVRDALKSDLEEILDFQINMAKETESIDLERDVLKIGVSSVLEDSAKAKYFIADNEGEAAGMLMITTEWSDWRNGWVWWIQSVYVKPGYRKMGVYKMLYNHIKKIVGSSDELKGIRLYVDKRNVRAQQVYESLGMTGDHYTTYEWMK
ncbi:MAG: GNAT family N-acetyltransferase [Bacteroidales bacterium]|nr:GNAT family N-acetyltransferase [Bacteroidales bacterium]MDD3844257.1 GNAT family N-acetyltransferase [Bacteroidales bacterium]MDD4618821.1 GNAT family N-acetyltransferase [Bacteroidales bacterium]